MKTPLRCARALVAISLLALGGCSGGGADAETSTDEVRTRPTTSAKYDLKKYAFASGIVAIDADATALHDAIKANGGQTQGPNLVLAGLTGKDMALTGEDASSVFGVVCNAHDKYCEITAVLESSGREPVKDDSGAVTGFVVKFSGKLARAVNESLPLTSPPGLVGSTTRGSGRLSCKETSGRRDADGPPIECTIPVVGAASAMTFHELVNHKDGPLMVVDVADMLIGLFFPKT